MELLFHRLQRELCNRLKMCSCTFCCWGCTSTLHLRSWECAEEKSTLSHLCWRWQSFYFVFLSSPPNLKVSFPFSPLSTFLHCVYSSVFPSNSLSPVLSSTSSWCVFRVCCCDTKPHHCHTHAHAHANKCVQAQMLHCNWPLWLPAVAKIFLMHTLKDTHTNPCLCNICHIPQHMCWLNATTHSRTNTYTHIMHVPSVTVQAAPPCLTTSPDISSK